MLAQELRGYLASYTQVLCEFANLALLATLALIANLDLRTVC